MASKYLHGHPVDWGERETGVRQLGRPGGRDHPRLGRCRRLLWQLPQDAAIFHDELAHMLLTQKVAFNSPVWFNVGCDRLEPLFRLDRTGTGYR